MDDGSHEILPVDVDSLGLTPFVSAPSSPGRSGGVIPCAASAAHLAYFFSAPASPTHFLLSSSPAGSGYSCNAVTAADLEQSDFEFGLPARSMSTAEELFFNGQIRPGFVSMDHHHHALVSGIAPSHRRTRSVLPSRNPRKLWREKRKELDALNQKSEISQAGLNSNSTVLETTNSNWVSASSTSRSSSSSSTSSSNSSSVSSRRWGFIKDLLTLQRSKSEQKFAVMEKSRPVVQRQTGRRRLTYSASFSPSLCKDTQSRRSADKADAVQFVKDARRRTTFLPYKQHGFLFGCLGFSSRGFVRNVSIPAVVVASRHN